MARPDQLAKAAEAARVRLTKSEQERRQQAQSYRPGVLYNNPQLISERWSCAVGRFRRIIEGLGKSSSVTGAIDGAEYPHLAREAIELWHFYFADRFKPPPLTGIDRNPFRGLSDKDAAGKFMRLVEDVCDRSTGKMGSWYAGLSLTGAARNR